MFAQSLSAQIKKLLFDFPEISLVYLFGSQVTGQVGPMSDVDLAILVDFHSESEQTWARFTHELSCWLQTDRVDVIILNQVTIELAYHVIATGRLLYERDTATRVEYEAHVMGMYGDYLPVLRAQRNQILKGDADAKRVQRYRTALRRTQRALIPPAAPAKQNPR
jgi:predicted nucleotidyltransferase